MGPQEFQLLGAEKELSETVFSDYLLIQCPF